jgi:hypothetical protein
MQTKISKIGCNGQSLDLKDNKYSSGLHLFLVGREGLEPSILAALAS